MQSTIANIPVDFMNSPLCPSLSDNALPSGYHRASHELLATRAFAVIVVDEFKVALRQLEHGDVRGRARAERSVRFQFLQSACGIGRDTRDDLIQRHPHQQK